MLFRSLTAEQTWQKPVVTEQINFGTKFTQELEDGWKVTGGYQISRIKTDDNLAFPWSSPTNHYIYPQGYPVNSNKFNSDGDFIIYDYRSVNETRQNQEIKFEISGKETLGQVTHDLTFGSSIQYRKVSQPNWINDCAGSTGNCSVILSGNIYNLSNSLSQSLRSEERRVGKEC